MSAGCSEFVKYNFHFARGREVLKREVRPGRDRRCGIHPMNWALDRRRGRRIRRKKEVEYGQLLVP